MTDKKISELVELLAPAVGDLLAIVDITASETKKITFQNLLIPDADSAVDLGSVTKFFANLYADQVNLASGVYMKYAADKWQFWEENYGSFYFYRSSTKWFSIYPATGYTTLATRGTNVIKFANDVEPLFDSSKRSGSPSKFWVETFTDELILTNVGAASAAANKLVLSAIDLSEGNTILDINTEGSGVVGEGTPAQTRTVAIRVNGVVYYLLAALSAT